MKRPLILTYGPNPFAPEHMRWAAAMVSDGRPGTHWMATGPTEEAARAKLQKMWDSQERKPSKPKTPKPASADVGDVI